MRPLHWALSTATVVLTAGSDLAVVYGNASRTTKLLAALSPAEGVSLRIQGQRGFSHVSMAGDMIGDGHAGLLAGDVGAPTVGAVGGTDGASYLLFSL